MEGMSLNSPKSSPRRRQRGKKKKRKREKISQIYDEEPHMLNFSEENHSSSQQENRGNLGGF
jgi:ribosomal protein L18